jgi:hypothetical protein
MDLVANPVSSFGIIDSEFCGRCLEKPMIIAIFESCLQSVMIDVTNRQFGFDSGNPYSLKLQKGHGTSGILSEGLVDLDGYFVTGHHLPTDQMFVYYLLRQI